MLLILVTKSLIVDAEDFYKEKQQPHTLQFRPRIIINYTFDQTINCYIFSSNVRLVI